MARIDQFLVKMADTGASDLHLTTSHPPMLRLHGSMLKIQGESLLTAEAIRALIDEIMPARSRAQFEETHDTDFAYEIEGLARFRVNVFMDRYGPGVVMRIIPNEILTLEELALPRSVSDFCYLSKGLVVVTGPTGSGKSTTLAAMVDHINKVRAEHVITIEDPIEFVHKSGRCLVNQREVGLHTKGFKSALRAALREDPDIVLVGEMRDLETVQIAMETAETGHVVFGTLHTTTAASTVDRIIDQFPTGQQNQIRTMLSNTLKGVIAQTLLKKKDGSGRVAAFEVLVVTSAVANHIREGKTHAITSAIQTGRKYGMVPLNESILEHVVRGDVAPEEAYLKAVDKQAIQARFQAHGIPFDPSQLASAEVATPGAEKPGPAAEEDEDDELDRIRVVEQRTHSGRVRQVKRKLYDDFEAFARERGHRRH